MLAALRADPWWVTLSMSRAPDGMGQTDGRRTDARLLYYTYY